MTHYPNYKNLYSEFRKPIRRFIVKNAFQRIVISVFILSCFLFTVNNVWSDGVVNQVAIDIYSRCEEPCPATIEAALKKLPGILSADVSFSFGVPSVIVKYEAGKVTVEQMNEALVATGYMSSPRT